MDYVVTLEAHLGQIVFGPHTDTLEGIQYTAARLRAAATLLEYRYAIERRAPLAALDDAQHGEQLAPAKRKRKHRATTRDAATNGAAPPPAGRPLFPTSTERTPPAVNQDSNE